MTITVFKYIGVVVLAVLCFALESLLVGLQLPFGEGRFFKYTYRLFHALCFFLIIAIMGLGVWALPAMPIRGAVMFLLGGVCVWMYARNAREAWRMRKYRLNRMTAKKDTR